MTGVFQGTKLAQKKTWCFFSVSIVC